MHERLARFRGPGHPSQILGCMHALLLAGANTQLIDVHGGTAPQWAEVKGQTTTAELGRQHAAPPQQTAASPAALLDAGEPVVSSPAPLPLEIYTTRPGEASCIRCSSGYAREALSTRSKPPPLLSPMPTWWRSGNCGPSPLRTSR